MNPMKATSMKVSENILLEMDEDELREHLVELGEDEDVLDYLNERELRDLAIDCHYPELMEHHSECELDDHCSSFPNETKEEFFDHEDH